MLFPAWATVIHMSYEGGGMKLRDLARSSQNPSNFFPAFRTFLSRLGNRGAIKDSRKAYEWVSRSSFTPHLLTSLQQTTMVPVFRVLHHHRNPWTPATFPVRAYHGDRNFHPRTCHKTALLFYFPNFRTEPTHGIPRSLDRWRPIPR